MIVFSLKKIMFLYDAVQISKPKNIWFVGTCARDLNCRDRDLSSRDRDETKTFAYMPETRPSIGLKTVSRPRRRDRDHIPAVLKININIVLKISYWYNRN